MRQGYLIFAIFVLLVIGCGPTKTTLPTPQTSTGVTFQNVNPISSSTSTSSSSVSTCAGMVGTIVTPAAGLVGAVTTIQYNNHSYLMSTYSNQSSKNFVYAVPAGQTLGICFSGTFTTQSGIFPNPSMVFDVVVLSSISFL